MKKTEKNKKRQDKKFGGKNSKQNSCQSSSEVDTACIQVNSGLSLHFEVVILEVPAC